MKSNKSTMLVSVFLVVVATCAAACGQTTRTWDGGGVGGTDLGIANFWSGDTLPVASAGDIMEWNNTVAGPLTLTYSTPNASMGATGGTNMGLNVSVTSAQTSPLTLLPIATATDPIRLNGVTIAAGAGAFTLGDANTSNVTLGTSSGQTHTWINNSSNTATVNLGVTFGNGGGGDHVLALDGTGNWSVSLVGGQLAVRAVSGTGVANIDGSVTLTGGGNGPSIGAFSATAGVFPILNVNSGTITLSGTTNASVFAGQTGPGAAGKGTVNQTGGDISLTGSVFVGSGTASTTNYGFYNMSGGSITQTGTNRFRIGQSTGAGSVALYYQSAGAVNTSLGVGLNDLGSAAAGIGGAAGMYVTGGTFTSTNGAVGSTTAMGLGIGGRQGTNEVTIAGTGVMTLNGITQLGGSAANTAAQAADNGRIGVLNLGTGSVGGTLQTSMVNQSATQAPKGYLNFNGGTLKAQTANTTYLTGLTQATVNSGGGTIDNNGVAITIGQNLVAPAGSGVTSIGVSGATGYRGAPYVQITGGGTPTTPATAVANVNGSGTVTNITITNPGSGYTSAPTVTLVGGGGAAGTLTPNVGAITSGGMTFAGSGTTTLTGANTYAGATQIKDFGKLVVTGSIGGAVSVNQGTLDGTGTVGATTVADDVSNVVANGNGAVGALTLSSLAFGGDATVNVRASSPGLVVSGALTTTPANGTVTINAASTTGSWANGLNNLISYGSFPGGSISNFTLGTISTPLNVRQASGGLVLNGNNIALSILGDNPKWTGLDNGNWVVGATGANGNWKLVTSGGKTDYIDGDAVEFDDSASGTTAVDISSSFVNPSSTVFNNDTKNYTINSSAFAGISGSGFLTKSGSGSVTITANNSYSGLTTMNGGTLTLSGSNTNNGGTAFNGGTLNANSANALGTGALTIGAGTAKVLNNTSGSAIAMFDNITQSWNDDFSFTGSSDLDMGTGDVSTAGAGTDRTVTVSAGTLTVGEVRSTAHGLIKQGAGTLVLTSTGPSGGGNGSNIGGTLNVAGGTLQLNRTGATGGDASTGDFTATGLAGAGTIANGAGEERWLFVNNTASNTFSGTLVDGSGGGVLGLNKSGTGTLTLSSANTYGGVTTVGNGTLNFSGSGSIANSSEYRIGNGTAVLQVDAAGRLGSAVINITSTGAGAGAGAGSSGRLELSGNIALTNNITLAQRNDTNFSDAIRNVGGSNTLSGPITIIAGGNQARISSAAGQLTLSGGITTTSTATRDLYLQGAGNGVVSGVIADNAGNAAGNIRVHKEGAGTWTLSNANTYTGTTIIDGGTLLVNNTSGSGTGTGAVAVNNGGTLGGTGTIDTSSTNANVTVAASGGISPGAFAGTLTFALGSGQLDLSAVTGGGLKFELGAPATPSASDQVKVNSGTLNLGVLDFSDFTFTNAGGAAVGTYKLFDAASPLAVSLNTASGSFSGLAATLSVDTTNFDVLLNITGPAGTPGDYNNNGIVDAADYVVWRKNQGTNTVLPNDPTGGTIGATQYNTWKANFGKPPGSGSAAGQAAAVVPEPATGVLLFLCGATAAGALRRRACKGYLI